MNIWYGLDRVPQDLGAQGTVVTIGVFDGVHRGHRAVLAETVRQARQGDLTSVALTFDPHPVLVHRAAPIRLVTTLADRIDRLAAAGIDAVAGAVAFTLAGCAALPFFGGGFIPELREGHFIVHMSAVPGTSIEESLRVGARVADALAALAFDGLTHGTAPGSGRGTRR